MSKAYDRLEWGFIESVLRRLGFNEKWIEWMMLCVTSVSYSFLLNGSAHGKVVPQRGIRQGDPLSPYIFILCSEVLSGLCSNAQSVGSLAGVKVAVKCPQVNHLLFADDTMFYCPTNVRSVNTLKSILGKYERASGQSINFVKSSISFSKRTPVHIRDRVKFALNITKEGGVGKYLGLPEKFGNSKKDLFSSILERIKLKASSWSSRFLSTAGKMTLLKSVLSAIPTYAMSCFKLPISLCKKIQSELTHFWCNAKPGVNKMAWIAWDSLTKPLQYGGLGFRDIIAFNDAMLAKLSWRLISVPDCLLAKVLKGKYYPEIPFEDSVESKSSSHGWSGIMAGKKLLLPNLGWAIGNGESARIWNDNWLGSNRIIGPIGPAPYREEVLPVSHLMVAGGTEWFTPVIENFLPVHLDQIKVIKPSKLNLPDKRIWLGSSTGDYSTKSGYAAAIESRPDPPLPVDLRSFNWLSSVWSIHTAPKIRLFLWKALRGAIATGENLARRGLGVDLRCKRCGQLETTEHILLRCFFAEKVWESLPVVINPSINPLETFSTAWPPLLKLTVLPPAGVTSSPLASWIIWHLWTARNKFVFEDKIFTVGEVVKKAVVDAREWEVAQRLEILLAKNKSVPRVVEDVGCTIKSDAAWNKDMLRAGIGWVLEDQNGVKVSESNSVDCVGSALMAEALALRGAMEFALARDFVSVNFKTDASQLVKAVTEDSSFVELYGVVEDIKSLASSFLRFSLSFIPCSLNEEADVLAKNALSNFVVQP